MHSADRFSDLLAPRESVRKAILLYDFPINTQVNGHRADKELKSGSLAPPLPTRAARRQQAIYEIRIFLLL
ncbi:MAG: hypothetical protein QMD03_06750 [Syntrophales bacterium]|nr:hypothetical protein [Syntrophales bacterium]